MRKILKWAGILLLLLIAAMMIYAFIGKKQTLNLYIGSVDLALIQDGVYTGEYECYRWSNTVEVTVKNHEITDIKPIKVPNGLDSFTDELMGKILTEQRPDVDAVSGATASSNAFQKAVENALTGAAER